MLFFGNDICMLTSFFSQADIATGMRIEEACYAQVSSRNDVML